MSGLIGHVMYAVLAEQEARRRGLPAAGLIERHRADYLAGSYLGCDIQTLPEAVCIDTGQEVGYGTVPLQRSPITGGRVRPWSLEFAGRAFRPRDIHRIFYGRAHQVFGWHGNDRPYAVPWDRLADYAADVIHDVSMLFDEVDRQRAYVLGWLVHIVGDSLIKSVRPGLELRLIDGKYTPRNRPVQDLVTFHEVGRRELKLDWSELLTRAARTPVPPIQPHFMRTAVRQGRLGGNVPDGWIPDRRGLLMCVLKKNREYLQVRVPRILKQLALNDRGDCDPELSRRAGGLSYREMVRAAEQAGFRRALDTIAAAAVDLMQRSAARA